MKEKILIAIYRAFEQWSDKLHVACQKGCSSCCTQNVTLTALEGTRIHHFIRKQQREKWFAGILQKSPRRLPSQMTSNEYAAFCLQGKEVNPDEGQNFSPCPFIVNNCCTIYEVRPFSCRCFASQSRCSPTQAAQLPEYYITASTAVMQLLEHLGQFDYWGNMIDVLVAQCKMPQNSTTALHLRDQSLPRLAEEQILKAKPLPGFLIPEEDYPQIEPLLTTIFSTKIEGRTIEQILNNR